MKIPADQQQTCNGHQAKSARRASW